MNSAPEASGDSPNQGQGAAGGNIKNALVGKGGERILREGGC